jgi:hypothetical protein
VLTRDARAAVTITDNLFAGNVGGDDPSGTVRVHGTNVALYNLNIANTYGKQASQSQAIALSAYGTQFGAYGLKASASRAWKWREADKARLDRSLATRTRCSRSPASACDRGVKPFVLLTTVVASSTRTRTSPAPSTTYVVPPAASLCSRA